MITGNCYIAGSFSDRPRLRGIRDELAALGIACTSRWLDNDGDETGWAERDLADIGAARTVILFTDVPSSAGGMHWECGYAYGCGMRIIGVGPKTNLFHTLIADWYPAWPELRAALVGEMS